MAALPPLDDSCYGHEQTTGPWDDELQAKKELLQFLNDKELFLTFPEISGVPLLTRPGKTPQSVRADVLAMPIGIHESRFECGAIVFEVKRPGEKIGPAISQLLDYLNSAFKVPSGVSVVPSYGFIFSAPPQHGTLASIMAQNHIGTAEIRQGILHLYCGEQRLLSIASSGVIAKYGNLNFGNKTGSR
jgi:hypothetical protein